MNGHGALRIGLEAGYDPTWPAGLLYIRNLVYTLASLPVSDQPEVRLLPLDIATMKRIGDLEDLPFVSVAAPPLDGALGEAALLIRRASRKRFQPVARRPLHRAFKGLDVSFPGWGTPIPGTPQIQWIPDLQHVHLPHLFEEDELRRRDRVIREIAFSEGVLVVSSEAALEDFLAAHPRPRIRPRVWRFCSSVTERESGGKDPRASFELPEFFFYVANQFWAHKDHLTLFKALALLRDDGLRPTVVCTGARRDERNPRYIQQVESFVGRENFEDQIRILGLIDRADQIQLFRHCAAVVQPSRFEGWSTVVEDAKALGRPLIISDIDVHREQDPDASFFETGSPESLATILKEIIPQLSAGPDPVSEERARRLLSVRRRKSALQFIAIAREAARRRD